MLAQDRCAWEISDMSTDDLKGQRLYDALMALKPADLTETDWAANAQVNRGWFSNLKGKGGSARADTIRKLLTYIGKTESDLYGAPVRPEPNAIPFKMEGASAERMREDLQIFGSALGAARIVDGEAIEQTTLNRAEVVLYAKRPVILNGNAAAYGLYVSGSSMSPRHEDGEVVVVDPKGRLRNGDDVVVYLRTDNPEDDNGEAARAVLVKRLVKRTSTYVELEQFTPPLVFRVEMDEVTFIHRVLPWSELLS